MVDLKLDLCCGDQKLACIEYHDRIIEKKIIKSCRSGKRHKYEARVSLEEKAKKHGLITAKQ